MEYVRFKDKTIRRCVIPESTTLSQAQEKRPREFEDPLERLVMQLLELAADQPMLVPAGFENAIRACMERDLPATRGWFLAELRQVLEDQPKPFEQRRWRDLPRAEIVKGAVRQIPGRLPQYQQVWMEVLKISEFATFAVYSLRSSPINVLDYLDAWWEAKPPSAAHDLRRFLTEIKGRYDPGQTLSYIGRVGAGWSPDFRIRIVNPLCVEMGFGLPFPPLA